VVAFLPDQALEPLGDAARHTEDALLNAAHGGVPLILEVTREKIVRVKAVLAGPDPSPMEMLPAERAAFCWVAVNIYEASTAQAEGVSIKQADFQQRRIDLEHKRLLGAIKALATIRGLGRGGPMVAVNIARTMTIGEPAREQPVPGLPGTGQPINL
jgi:hypothetical protein